MNLKQFKRNFKLCQNQISAACNKLIELTEEADIDESLIQMVNDIVNNITICILENSSSDEFVHDANLENFTTLLEEVESDEDEDKEEEY